MSTAIKLLSVRQSYPVLGGLMLWLCGAAMFGRMSIGIEYSLLMGVPRFIDSVIFFIIWLASSLIAARLINTSNRHISTFSISLLITIMIWGFIELLYDQPFDTIRNSLNFMLAPVSHVLLPVLILAGTIILKVHKQPSIIGSAKVWLLRGAILQIIMVGLYFFMTILFPYVFTQERRLLIILIGFVLASLYYGYSLLSLDNSEKSLLWKSIAAFLLLTTSFMANLT